MHISSMGQLDVVLVILSDDSHYAIILFDCRMQGYLFIRFTRFCEKIQTDGSVGFRVC